MSRGSSATSALNRLIWFYDGIWIAFFRVPLELHLLQHSVGHSNLVPTNRMLPTLLLCTKLLVCWSVALIKHSVSSLLEYNVEKFILAFAFVMRVFRWKSNCFWSLRFEFNSRSIFIIFILNVKRYSGKIAWLNYQRPIIELNQNCRVRQLSIECVWGIAHKINRGTGLFHFKGNRGILNSWNGEILWTIAKSRERENGKIC